MNTGKHHSWRIFLYATSLSYIYDKIILDANFFVYISFDVQQFEMREFSFASIIIFYHRQLPYSTCLPRLVCYRCSDGLVVGCGVPYIFCWRS